MFIILMMVMMVVVMSAGGLCVMVDVPRHDTVLPDNATLNIDAISNKNLPGDTVRGLVEQSHVHRGDSGDGASQSLGVVFLGATVGVAIVLAVLLVAVVVCFMVAGRRRRDKRLAKRADDPSRPLPLPPINGHIESGAFERRAPNNHYVSTSSLQHRATTPSQQPVPPARKDSRASSVVQMSATASPKPYRTAASTPAGPECPCATLPARTALQPGNCSSTFHTMMTPVAATPSVDDARYLAQRRAAWDAILQRQGNPDQPMPLPASDVTDAADRPISMSELPPPPDFLLENAGPEVQLTGGAAAVKTGGGRMFVEGRTTSPLLFEVTDGYRSADSVDDDIDDVDFTIRQPSVHGGVHLQYA